MGTGHIKEELLNIAKKAEELLGLGSIYDGLKHHLEAVRQSAQAGVDFLTHAAHVARDDRSAVDDQKPVQTPSGTEVAAPKEPTAPAETSPSPDEAA